METHLVVLYTTLACVSAFSLYVAFLYLTILMVAQGLRLRYALDNRFSPFLPGVVILKENMIFNVLVANFGHPTSRTPRSLALLLMAVPHGIWFLVNPRHATVSYMVASLRRSDDFSVSKERAYVREAWRWLG